MISRRSSTVQYAMFVLLLVLVALCGELLAVSPITTTGSVNPAYDSSDPWVINVGDEFIVGFEATGSLSIAAGSDVTANLPTYIGDYAWEATGTTGTLLLTGLGSTFTIDPAGESELFIGPMAEGHLTVADQAILTSHDSIIGGSPEEEGDGVVAGTGYATVTGGGQWDAGWLTVGAAGFGQLTAELNGLVTSDTGEIGLLPDGVGEVSVDQSGSWVLTGDLIVGVWGQGAMEVTGGGQVTSGRGWVGGVDPNLMNYAEDPFFEGLGNPAGTGEVTVTGGNSLWDSGDTLVVGAWGTGTLTIEDQGRVAGQEVYIGGMPITPEEGQEFTQDLLPNGTGTVTVTGEGSRLEVTGDETLYVGYSGIGTLNVEAGGDVTTVSAVIGGTPDSVGVIEVTGAGSTLSVEEEIEVGAWGTGDLIVSDGGTVSTLDLDVGGFDANGAEGLPQAVLDDFGAALGVGTVTVTGADSLVDVSHGEAYIGNYGTGFADVNDGGTVITAQTALGVAPGSYGEITVDGIGSSWNVNIDPDYETDTGLYSGVMVVGGYGEGLVTISNGAEVTVDDVIFVGGYPSDELGFDAESVGYEPNGVGTITVTGSGSTLVTDGIHVGDSGQGTLEILNGGAVTNEVAMVGVAPGSVGEVLINGDGSLWQNAAGAFVGGYGEGTVTVSGGGRMDVGEALYIGGFEPNEFEFDAPYVGDPNGAGTVTVTGTGSLVEAFAIAVGATGTGTLEILNGARVESQAGAVGVVADAVGTVTVDGEGSTWRLSGDGELPTLWELNGEGELTISNGGLVEVEDPNAVLAVADSITVGSEGEGTLTIANGGRVFSDSVVLGGTNPELGNIEEYFDPNAGLGAGTGAAVVSGAGSEWNTEDMQVGFSGTGNLTIASGGSVVDDSGWIGLMPDAVGAVLVTGADSTWTNDDNLVVGAWGQGDLTIAAGGVVMAPEVYIGGTSLELLGEAYDPDLIPDGTGTVTVTGAGSELFVTSGDTLYVGYSATGMLDVNEGGTVTAGAVVIGAAPDGVGAVTVTGDGSAMDVEWETTVGLWGQGSLTVSDHGQVTTDDLFIGGYDVDQIVGLDPQALADYGDPNGSGTVIVTGAGSQLQSQNVFAGVTGDGAVGVEAGGYLGGELGVVGLGDDSIGTALVTGADSVFRMQGVGEDAIDYGTLVVGGWGDGQLTVSDGGLADTSRLYIGGFDPNELADRGLADDWGQGYPAGAGTVIVMGEGSRLNVSGDQALAVGYSGVGTLTASEGGQILTNLMTIGSGPDGTGTVTIDGGILTAASDVIVGAWGQGNLTVSNGGEAEVGALVIGGFDANDAPVGLVEALGDPNGAGTVAITDANSALEVTGDDGILVGYSGQGALEILDGAEIASHIGIIGVTADGVGQVTVDDAFWRITGDQASDLTAQGDGELSINNDGMVLVEDPNGLLDVAGTIYVGSEGLGAMAVMGGARLFSDTAALGLLPGGTGEVLVGSNEMGLFSVVGPEEPAAAVWENSGRMVVGGYGNGLLAISGDGEVYSDDLYIGGFDPEAGIFDIEDPGYDPNGVGEVMVTGDGALLDTELLVVGTTGEGELDIVDGGQVNSEVGMIGFGPDSAGYVFVDGTGSTWTLYDPNESGEDWSILGVGVYGAGVMTISDGGHVTVADAVLGGFDLEDIGAPNYEDRWGDPNGTGTIIVMGEGSLLDVEWGLCVGHSGIGNLLITEGGQVNGGDGILGDEPNGIGTVAVSGASSQWDLSDDLYVGGYGTGTLTISDGGFVTVEDDAHVGYGQTGNGTVLVTGENSVLEIRQDLFVGGTDEAAGGLGSLYVNDGGWVNVWNEMYVWETGLVGGDGTITVMNPTTLHNYGTIAPGDEGIGILTVEGAVVFHAGSTFAVDINNVASDKLVVDGDVTIQGGTVAVSSSGTILGEHQYEILTGDTIVGEFNDLDTALLNFSFSDAGLDYNDASVWLHVTAANFSDPNIAQTENQRALGGALQGIGGNGGNGVTDAVQDLETVEGVRGAYDQLAGQSRPPLAPMTVAGSSKFLGTVSSRVQNVQTGLVAGAFDYSPMAMASAGPDQVAGGSPAQEAAARGQTFAVGNGSRTLAGKPWGVWGRGYGLFGDRDAEGGVPGYSYNIRGGSFGVDYQFTESFLAGIVGGLSEGDVDFGSSRDSTDFDAAHFGLYGSLARGPWYVDSIVTFAGLDYETERFVDILDERLTGNFDGHEFAAYVEASRSFDLNPRLRLAPLVSLQYTHLNLDSYTETGGAGALAFDEQTHESVRGSLGARLTQRLIESTGDFRADLQVRGRWVHEFGDERSSVDSSFASDPTVVFTVRDGETSRDSAILGTGLSAQVSERTKVYLDYDARLNSDETVQVISASLQYRW